MKLDELKKALVELYGSEQEAQACIEIYEAEDATDRERAELYSNLQEDYRDCARSKIAW